MSHQKILDPLVKTCLITGLPGVGYETVIKELAKRSYSVEIGDKNGFRYSSQHNVDWFYHLETIKGRYAESEVNFVSMGGKNSPMLFLVPWKAIFVLTAKFQLWFGRANAFRKKVGLLPLTTKEARAIYDEYMNFASFISLYSGNFIFKVNADVHWSKVADQILEHLEDVSVQTGRTKSELLYSEMNMKMPQSISKTQNIYVLVGETGSGKSHITAMLRQLYGLAAYTGDHLRANFSMKDGEIDWNSNIVIKDNVLKHYDVLTYPKNAIFESKRTIIEIVLLPDAVKWRTALYNRNNTNYVNGGHSPKIQSYPTIMHNVLRSKTTNYVYNDFTDGAVESVYNMILLTEKATSTGSY